MSLDPSISAIFELKLRILKYLWMVAATVFAVAGFETSVSAQTYDFQNFTVETGLSQSQVLSLMQTKTGELWVGTNQGGITKWNGSTFSYLAKEQGLSDNVVFAMVQEESGRILIGTYNGLNLITGNRIDSLNTDRGLPHKGVVSILVSSSNEVWLGTGKGVGRLVGDTVIPFNQDSILSSSTVYNIREGTNGTLWFCTTQNGLFRWDGKTMLNISTKDGLNHNYVYDVMPLGKYDAWIFGYKGLFKLENTHVERIQLPAYIPDNAGIQGYLKDKANNIWVGTTVGVLKYRDGEWSTLTKENGLVDNNIWKIIQDREGNIWFGSKSIGVSKMSSERFRIFKPQDGLPNKTVNSVMRDRQGRFWLGTKEGIGIWDGNRKDTITEPDGLSSEVISDIDQATDGTIYITTDFGLTVYDGHGFKGYLADQDDLNDCRDVLIDGQTIWIGTKGGPAVFEKGRITKPYNAIAFDDYVFDAVRKDNDIWFAYEDGVLKFDGERFTQLKAKDGFFDGRCRSVIAGPNGNLWFGTNDGIYRYNGKECKNYSSKDGLISDAVYSLGFDHKGNLWVGQGKGLSTLKFNGDALEDVIRYGKEQGFMGLECSTNSFWMDDDGKIWVGTTNGLVEYDPSLDKGAFFKPLMRITDIQLFSQKVDWRLFCDSVDVNGFPISLELPSDKNNLTFFYSGVSLTSPSSINYSYMLEGFDEGWSEITNDTKRGYTNLGPGNYTFMVRAGFGDELWKNDPVSFRFVIKAPWYRTPWFYSACVVLALAIAYSYYTIRRANIQITEQKQKIESQKDVIEKKNQEMVDSINYASTIQTAILPSEEQWHKLLPDSFVLYRPKDIVSGDFYWLANRGDDVYFAVVDCTGHGVPGALMSMVGYNGLNQAVNEHGLAEPSEILNYLSQSVNESLRKAEHDDYVRDGMDVALCRLNRKTMTLQFAGAFNPLFIVRNGKELLTKGDRIAIGSMDPDKRSFETHEEVLHPGDCVYIYSDGYADQFGGLHGKKMKTTVMRQKIVALTTLSMSEQKNGLETFLEQWQGTHDQVDDICVIGVRV